MLHCQHEFVGQQTRMALQRALGRNPRQRRKIIAFREMAEDHVSGLAVVLVFQEFRRRIIGEMANAGEDALLH